MKRLQKSCIALTNKVHDLYEFDADKDLWTSKETGVMRRNEICHFVETRCLLFWEDRSLDDFESLEIINYP